jgi:hypothetical protein
MAFAYYLGTTRSSRMKDETLSKVVKWNASKYPITFI